MTIIHNAIFCRNRMEVEDDNDEEEKIGKGALVLKEHKQDTICYSATESLSQRRRRQKRIWQRGGTHNNC